MVNICHSYNLRQKCFVTTILTKGVCVYLYYMSMYICVCLCSNVNVYVYLFVFIMDAYIYLSVVSFLWCRVICHLEYDYLLDSLFQTPAEVINSWVIFVTHELIAGQVYVRKCMTILHLHQSWADVWIFREI